MSTQILPDDNRRLKSVMKDSVLTESYGYDHNGNRTTQTNTARGIASQVASYNLADQLTQDGNVTYQYDVDGYLTQKADGNDITRYAYSRQGRLLSVQTPTDLIEYRHNALGNRAAKIVNGQTTEKYLWLDKTTLLATYDGNGTLKQRFEYTLGHTPTSFTQNGSRYYIATDHLGSPRVISDENGNIIKAITYDSYGNVISDSNPASTLPFGFAGGLQDRDTRLIRFGFRDYDPAIGRWTARDPIGLSGGLNIYGYVLGNPVTYVDLYGLEVEVTRQETSGPGPFIGNDGGDVLQIQICVVCADGTRTLVPDPVGDHYDYFFEVNKNDSERSFEAWLEEFKDQWSEEALKDNFCS